VQEAFCHIARAAKRTPDAVTIRYVSRVVRNECYTMLRKRRHLASADLLLEQASGDSTEEERMVLSDALKALPPEQREVVFLKVFEGFTFQEIADMCDISINTAASRHRYALAALRRALEPVRSNA
jgi:RNA polymerase sigma-70 factor (ECF subfamily)